MFKSFTFFRFPWPFRASRERGGDARNWIAQIRTGREKSHQVPASIAPDRKKTILVFSLIPWHHGVIEYCLATNLISKGHNVVGMLCGGILPACSMEKSNIPRPACNKCLETAKYYTGAFGMKYHSTTDFLTRLDLDAASKIVECLDKNELMHFEYQGVRIGKNTMRDLCQYYHRLVTDLENPEVLATAKKFVVSGILNCLLAQKSFERFAPDIVVISNGKAISYSSIFETALLRGIETISWDESPAFRNGFTFNRNTYANEIHLEKTWRDKATHVLSPSQREQITEYFTNWKQGKNARYQYYDSPVSQREEVLKLLNIPTGRKVICYFSNLVWETSHLGRNIGFNHLFDAIVFLIEYAIANPSVHLVVRAHPAEVKVPEQFRTTVPLHQLIDQRFPHLPDNITVIKGESEISSYTLGQIADYRLVYTSTVGLEFVLQGLPTIVLGDAHFRKKGFTIDIESSEQLRELLNAQPNSTVLSADEVELAFAYAYLWIFRHVMRVPFLDTESRQWYKIPDFTELFAGSGSIIDKLGDTIISGNDFLDLN